MPMERSVSCAERGSVYGGAADIRSYSASYARPAAAQASSRVVKHARRVSSWTRPAPPPVQRSGSTKSVAGGGGGGARQTPGLNLRSYSASYAASYGPTTTVDGGGGGGQLKRSGSVTNWTSANRRSVNLRGYTPSFAALDDTATAVPAAKKAAAALDDAELQRRKRLVVYKTYDVEGKVRGSVRRGVTWIKGKCSRVVYGWW